MKFVDNAKEWWKWNSMQLAAILSALPAVWMQLPPEFKEMVPDWAWAPVGVATFLGMLIARVRVQE